MSDSPNVPGGVMFAAQNRGRDGSWTEIPVPWGRLFRVEYVRAGYDTRTGLWRSPAPQVDWIAFAPDGGWIADTDQKQHALTRLAEERRRTRATS